MGVSVMPITTAGKPKSCVLSIEGDVVIENVKELYTAVIDDTVYAKDNVVLNLGKVKHCDTAGLQFIWSFMKEAELKGKKVEIHDVSAAVFEMAFETGIDMEKILNFKWEKQ